MRLHLILSLNILSEIEGRALEKEDIYLIGGRTIKHRRGDERPSLPPSPSWSSFAFRPSLAGPVGENLQTPKPMINVFMLVRKMTNCTRCAVCGSLWTNGWWKTGTPTGLWWRWWWRTTWTASTTSIRRMSATKGDSSSLYLNFLSFGCYRLFDL